MAEFRVKAAAIVVPVSGTERYLYRGAPLPEGVTDADRKRLIDVGLVEEVAEPAAEPVPQEPAPQEPVVQEVKAARRPAATKTDVKAEPPKPAAAVVSGEKPPDGT